MNEISLEILEELEKRNMLFKSDYINKVKKLEHRNVINIECGWY